jgi:tetratricopeptide (TPR) repeat protein
MKPTLWLTIFLGLLMCFLPGGAALAQPTMLESIDPADGNLSGEALLWHQGVTEAQRSTARQHFYAGNDFIHEGLFAEAEAEYREALRFWDNPGIHYNLAIALINLDKPIAAYQSLEKAMSMGAAPLDIDKYEQARNYHKLLETQLARLEVECEAPGAAVTMNGEFLFTAPGHYKGIVQPGGYQLIANQPGSLPSVEQVALSPGQSERVVLIPWVKKRHWARWKPWAVTAAGASLVLVGAYFDGHSSKLFREFDVGLISNCPYRGCLDDEIRNLADRRERAEREQWASLGLYLAGAAALTTGAVLVYQNREQWVRGARAPESVSFIIPVIAPGSAAVHAYVHF